MANLSKIKRDNMIAFLEELKQQHTDDASIRAFNEIENHLREKKYGLVWEEHSEEVDESLAENIPVLTANHDRRLCKDINLPWNFIIEGDNLQALILLEKTHRGKIDCIYIDPPYNTGKSNWKYNNDYVDKKDTFRHSKWLSMIGKRLEIARNLLTEDGTLIFTIDENELGTSLLLLQDIFGPKYAIDCIAVVHNPRGIQGDNFSYVHEYAIFVYKRGTKVVGTREVSEEEIDWSPLRNWGDESERYDAANCFYPIYVKDGKIAGFGDDVTAQTDFHPAKNVFDEKTGITAVYPIDVEGIERKWRYARQSVESIYDLLRVKENNGVFDIEIGKDFAPYKTVWTDKRFDANEYGTQIINSMVPDNGFDFPKSVHNVEECIYAVTQNKPNAIILDFFAGSGTTGHATLLVNKNHGGNRRFILCTNNDVGEKKEKEYKKLYSVSDIDKSSDSWLAWAEQFGIASSVTYPRVCAAINGFVHKKDFKTVVFEKKLTLAVIKKADKLLSTIEKVKEEFREDYDEFKVEIDSNRIVVYGVQKKQALIDGITANLKYFKCDWTPRKPEDYLLSNALCLHIREMIELQGAIEIDNVKNVLILNKSDFKNIIQNTSIYPQIENIWVNQNIVLNSEELKLLQAKGFKYIPREFFGQELREAAE